MANSDYLTINGSQVSLSSYLTTIDRCTPFVRGGIPELGFSRILGKLTSLPDPWSGQPCAWLNGSTFGSATTYFTGDVVGYTDRYEPDIGWVREYRALGLRDRADWIPVTDSNTLSDTAQYNLPSNNPACIPAREGRTMGQAVLDVLSMAPNVTPLAAAGIGNFTSTGYGGAGLAVLGGVDSYGYSVASISVAQPGSGYTVAPTVVLAGTCTTQASFTASVSGGQITGFTLISGGSGYLNPPTVIISTLPTATVNDLAALTVVPPFPISFAGERMIQNIESVIQTCHPNHSVYIIGDNAGSDVIGTIRVLDQRQYTNNTITLGGTGTNSDGTSQNRWLMPSLHRDMSDSYSQVIVRGGLQTGSATLALKQWPGSSWTTTWAPSGGTTPTGGLVEDFSGWGGYTTNAAAKAAWSPSMFATLNLQSGQDQGSCTCPSTTTVQITSQNSNTYTADQLDQTVTGLHAIITVMCDSIPGVTQSFSARVTQNNATSSGTTLLTVDQTLPSTSYNSFTLTFSSAGGNVTWRRYYVVNRNIAAAMQQSFPYPFAYRNSSGAAALTSAPVCTVLWSSSGSPPYNVSTIGVAIDPVAGTITTQSPTCLVYGGGVVTPPVDVQVFVPVATGLLSVTYPSSGYAGTLYSVEGISRTKTVTVREWTDYSLNANMAAYAQELFNSICDVVMEGTISYLGLASHYFSPGQALSIAGNGYTTGYESIANTGGNNGIAVASVDIQFNPGPGGTSYVTTLHLSNRKQRYTGDIFVRPAVTGQQIGGSGWSAGAYAGLASFMGSGALGGASELAGQVKGAAADLAASVAGNSADLAGISQGAAAQTAGAFSAAGEGGELAIPQIASLEGPGQAAKQVAKMTGDEMGAELQRRVATNYGGLNDAGGGGQ